MWSTINKKNKNLVLYDLVGNVIWSSGTAYVGMKPAKLTIGCDGKLSLTDNAGTVLWSKSKTSAQNTPTRLVVQNDRNLVMYDRDNKVVWSASTVAEDPIVSAEILDVVFINTSITPYSCDKSIAAKTALINQSS